METAEQARARATTILIEHNIPEGVVRVIDAANDFTNPTSPRSRGGRGCTDNGSVRGEDGIFRLGARLFYRDYRVTNVEVCQGFNDWELRRCLQFFDICIKDRPKKMAELEAKEAANPTPVGYAKIVLTRKPHECKLDTCAAREIHTKSRAVAHTLGEPGMRPWGYGGYYHPDCYASARLTDRSLPELEQAKT